MAFCLDWALTSAGRWTSILGLLGVMQACFVSGSTGADRGPSELTSFEPESLILQNRELQGHEMSVHGMVACATEHYCRFIMHRRFDAIVTVDWELLPPNDRLAFLLNCDDAHPCQVTLTGVYGPDYNITAESLKINAVQH
jgi:hypothetical protein